MGADPYLMQGAYYAAGGGVDTNRANAWKNMFSDVLTNIAPTILKKSIGADNWADEKIAQREADIANGVHGAMSATDWLEYEKVLRAKKWRYIFSNPNQQTAILGEMIQDKKEIQAWDSLKSNAAIRIKDEN